jgi:tetratricopeptide (TPR) repeat protein
MKSPSLEKVVSITLIAACLCVFGGVARNGFVNFDDGWYVTLNPHVRSGLTFESTAWAFKTMSVTNWHPLTWLSHMLDYQLFGLNPTGHHLNNLFLHIANALLLFLLLRNTTGRLWESAAVAALFALHPLRVESVAWISERKDVLSGFFGMLTMLAYVHYVRRQSLARYALTLLLFALGLMAKPMLVTLPFVLLLLDFWPLHRFKIPEIRDRATESTFFFPEGSSHGMGALVIEKIPFFSLSAVSSVVTYIAQSTGGAVSSFEAIPLKTRIANALVSCWQYLEKTFWPQNLAVFYPHPGSNLPLGEVVLAGLFLLAVSVLVLFQARHRPFLLTGWLWFLGMLVPVLGILQVGGQSMADRYTYLPSIGIFIMIAWIPQSLPWRVFHREFLLASGFTVILLSLSSITWLQTGYWKDTETLFQRTAAVTENNYLAHCLMGDALASQNQLTMAVSEYEKALAIFPRYAEAHHQLGMVLAKQGCPKEAVAHYEEALRAKPKYALAHTSIAGAMAEQGNLDEAISHYLEALCLDPDSAGAVYNGLGVVMAKMQRLDESIYYLFKAVELCPDCPEGHANLGRVLTLQGNLQAAFEQLFKAIELQPSSAETHNNLALAYLQIGALDEALYHFASALHLRNDYGKARANLRHILSRMSAGEPIESSP